VQATFGKDWPVDEWAAEEGADDETIRERLMDEADKAAAQKAAEMGASIARQIEKAVLLQTVDQLWREHLIMVDSLRSVIGLRGYGQRDPLNEYKSEAFSLFDSMLNRLRTEVTAQLAHVRLAPQAPPPPQMEVTVSAEPSPSRRWRWPGREARLRRSRRASPAIRQAGARWGATRLCPCGSGKKFKHCHGRA
jgi:preprotein translocase subunit SecA